MWDGNKVLHEWKEYQENNEDTNQTKQQSQTTEISQPQKAQNIVTWLYKDGSFVPIGKLTENDSYSIVTDHLGTPTEMYNSKGERVWKVIRDIYGRERHKVGGETPETDCQIRFQGQYEDYETGLYYNRNRYYMPEESMYSQRDPIGIAGGNPSLYGYVWDSSRQVDVFGLEVVESAIDGIKKGSLSDLEARKWYLSQEAKIKDMIDTSLSLEEQAKQAFNLRNQFRTQARELMANRNAAEELMKTNPNLTWNDVIQKYTNKGYSGDELYKEIIEASTRSRQSVNKSLGLE